MRDSVETAVFIHLFKTQKESACAHIFHSRFEFMPLSKFRDMDNFNPDRLSLNPYPIEDRPRGQDDLSSIRYHRHIIRLSGQTDPVWVAHSAETGRYTLLDGAHRIASTFIEGKRTIPCYILEC